MRNQPRKRSPLSLNSVTAITCANTEFPWEKKPAFLSFSLSYPIIFTMPQCVKDPFFVQKLQILERILLNWDFVRIQFLDKNMTFDTVCNGTAKKLAQCRRNVSLFSSQLRVYKKFTAIWSRTPCTVHIKIDALLLYLETDYLLL